MLIWAAAIGPVLLVARGMEFAIFSDLDASSAFQSIWLSLSIATLNLVVIWVVLGAGPWPIRIAALMLIPLVLSFAVERYADSIRPRIGQPWTSLSRLLRNMDGEWGTWLWLNAALMAALLMFVRANGYRLLRASSDDRLEQSQ